MAIINKKEVEEYFRKRGRKFRCEQSPPKGEKKLRESLATDITPLISHAGGDIPKEGI